jgi:hypothetical protein
MKQALADCYRAQQLQPNNAAIRDNLRYVRLKSREVRNDTTNDDSVLRVDPEIANVRDGSRLATLTKDYGAVDKEDMSAARVFMNIVVVTKP